MFCGPFGIFFLSQDVATPLAIRPVFVVYLVRTAVMWIDVGCSCKSSRFTDNSHKTLINFGGHFDPVLKQLQNFLLHMLNNISLSITGENFNEMLTN